MMDKNREAFEAWFAGTRSCLDDKSKMFKTDELGYTDELEWTAFAAWQASRAAIEIKLPTEITYRCDTSPILRAQNCGYNDAVADCGSIINSHGIRIKGKTE